MRNEIYESIPELLVQGEACANGAVKYEQETGLKQNRATDVRADIVALVNDSTSYDEAEAELSRLREERRKAIEKAKVFAALARELLKAHAGRVWSENWVPMGFTKSLRMPVLYGEIQSLVHSLGLFFQNNPQLERKDSKTTAAEAKALFTALNDGQNKINAQRTRVQNLLASRNKKAAQMRRRVRGLINELKQVIDPLDNRWLAFGFNKPGLKQTPEAPSEVKAVQVLPNTIAVEWKPSARAAYYRVRMKVEGIDEEPVLIGNPSDPNFTIEDVPTDVEVEIAVSAVNASGESPSSEIVVVKVKPVDGSPAL